MDIITNFNELPIAKRYKEAGEKIENLSNRIGTALTKKNLQVDVELVHAVERTMPDLSLCDLNLIYYAKAYGRDLYYGLITALHKRYELIGKRIEEEKKIKEFIKSPL